MLQLRNVADQQSEGLGTELVSDALNLLYHSGYVTMAEEVVVLRGQTFYRQVVQIPNREMHELVSKAMMSGFKNHYKLPKKLLEDTTDAFYSMMLRQDETAKETRERVGERRRELESLLVKAPWWGCTSAGRTRSARRRSTTPWRTTCTRWSCGSA